MQIITTFELGGRNDLYLGAFLRAPSWIRIWHCSVLRKMTGLEGRSWMERRSCSIPEPGSFPKCRGASRRKQHVKGSLAEKDSKKAAGTV